MNNVKFYLASFCVAVLALSCEKAVELNQPNENEAAPQLTTIRCEFPKMTGPNETKVSLATTGKTQWEVGDKIVIYGNPSSSDASKRVVHEIVAADIDNPEVAVFDVDLSGLEAQYSSGVSETYYPYTVAYPYTDGQPYYLSTGNNNYGRARFQNTNQLLMAGHVSDDNSTIVLNHVTAAITFSVSGDFDTYTFSGSDGTEVVGYSNLVVEMNRRSLGEGMYRQKYNNSGTSGDLTSIQGSVNGNGTAVNHIFLPVNAQKSGAAEPYTYTLDSQRYANVVYLPNGFTIKFYKGGNQVKYITSTAPLVIEPGHMINLGLLPAGAMKDYVAPTAHNNTIEVDVNTAYDLSSSASANCYLLDSSTELAANKAYKFKAAKGKGGDVLTNIGGDEDKDVVVLWATKNNTSAPSASEIIAAVDYDMQVGEDAYIVFKMPATITPGNAVIAAKNTAGEVLWSWHIWIPSTDITSSTYGISTTRMMDRNLGALVIAEGDADTDIAVESCGLFYQWGRKDPFPGPGNLLGGYSSSSAAVYGTVGTRAATSSADIYKYPNLFVETGGDGTGTKDWSTDHSSSLWGSVKNANDPCPPGWKLPIFDGDDDANLWSTATSKTSLAGYTLNQTHHWLKLGVDFDAMTPNTTGYVYFPLAGYRTQDNSSYAYAGGRALIWQAYGEGGEYAKCLYSDGGFVGYRTERKGRGGNVRCVAE